MKAKWVGLMVVGVALGPLACGPADETGGDGDGDGDGDLPSDTGGSSASGGESSSNSGGSSSGGTANTGGAPNSGGTANTGGNSSTGGSSVSEDCQTFCQGESGVVQRCASLGLPAEWDTVEKCETACGTFDSTAFTCWLDHLDNEPAADHCGHATGAPGNGICPER